MRTYKTINIVAALVVALTVTASYSVQARPNDGRYQTSSEANKRRVCIDLKIILDANEEEADKRAGTPAAAEYAKNADMTWAAAAKSGCSWAQ